MSTSAGDLDVTLGAVTAEYDAAMKGAIDAMQKFGVGSKDVGDALVGLERHADDFGSTMEKIRPMLRENARESVAWLGVVESLREPIRAMKSLGQSIGDLSEAMDKGSTAKKMQAIGEATEKAALAAPALVTAFTELPQLLVALAPIGAAVVAVAAAIALVIVAVGALKIAWDKNLWGIRDTVVDVANTVAEAWSKSIGWLVDFMDASSKKIRAQYYLIKGTITGDMAGAMQQWAAGNAAPSFSQTVSSGASTAMDAVTESWRQGVEVIKSIFGTSEKSKKTDPDKFNFAGDAGQTPMNVLSSAGIDTAAHSATGVALAAEQSKAMAGYKKMSDSINAASKDAADTYVAALDDGSMKFSGLYNAAADTVGQEAASALADVGSKFVDIAESVGGAASKFGEALGGTLAKGGGEMGKVSGAIMQASSGGPWAMLGAGIGQIVMRTKGFQSIIKMFDQVIGKLVVALEPLVKSLMPLALLIANLLGIVAEQLVPVFEGLTPVFTGLFEVIKAVLLAVGAVFQGLGGLWNGILEAIATVFKKLGDIEIFGKHPLGFMNGWADTISKGQINMAGLDRAMETLRNTTVATAETYENTTDETMSIPTGVGDQLQDLGNVADDVAESLSNVPSGYKVALARFNASDFGPMTPALAGATAGGGSTVIDQAPRIEVHNMIVQAPTAEVAAAVVETLKRDNVIRTGSNLTTTSPYVGGRKTQER